MFAISLLHVYYGIPPSSQCVNGIPNHHNLTAFWWCVVMWQVHIWKLTIWTIFSPKGENSRDDDFSGYSLFSRFFMKNGKNEKLWTWSRDVKNDKIGRGVGVSGFCLMPAGFSGFFIFSLSHPRNRTLGLKGLKPGEYLLTPFLYLLFKDPLNSGAIFLGQIITIPWAPSSSHKISQKWMN